IATTSENDRVSDADTLAALCGTEAVSENAKVSAADRVHPVVLISTSLNDKVSDNVRETAIDLAVVSLNVRVSASARLIPRPLATESDIEAESVIDRAWDVVRDGVSDNDSVSVTDRVTAIAERIAESLKDAVYVIERIAAEARERESLNETESVTDLAWD